MADDVARAVARKTPWPVAKAYIADVPAHLREAHAVAMRSQPETGEAARRYAERALGVCNRAPINGSIVQPYPTFGLLTRAEAETVAGLTGVKLEDYALLPRIIAEADRIEYSGTSNVGRPMVRVVKRMGDLEYWAVFEVRGRPPSDVRNASWYDHDDGMQPAAPRRDST